MSPEASAIWGATAATIAVQLLIAGFLWGKLTGELRLIKYRITRVERALALAGVKLLAPDQGDDQ